MTRIYYGSPLRQAEKAVIVPMAVEYCFWNERFPEALVSFGKPIDMAVDAPIDAPIHAKSSAKIDTQINARDRTVAEWTRLLETHLQETMDRLAVDAMSRNPARFHRIRRGRTGMGGIYSLYKRVAASLRGKPFEPDHTHDPSDSPA
jgi:hypothetical protein